MKAAGIVENCKECKKCQHYIPADEHRRYICAQCQLEYCPDCEDWMPVLHRCEVERTCTNCGMTCKMEKDQWYVCTNCGYVFCPECRKWDEPGHKCLPDDCKRCPNCGVVTQKRDDCNHIQCQTCGRHWCWQCQACFMTGSQCYNHMMTTHDDYFD